MKKVNNLEFFEHEAEIIDAKIEKHKNCINDLIKQRKNLEERKKSFEISLLLEKIRESGKTISDFLQSAS